MNIARYLLCLMLTEGVIASGPLAQTTKRLPFQKKQLQYELPDSSYEKRDIGTDRETKLPKEHDPKPRLAPLV